MKLPHKTLERKLFADGYKYVIGVDEVGMASLAGPVYVCAVLFTKQFFLSRKLTRLGREKIKLHPRLHGLRDSKQLLPHQREKFYNELIKEKNMRFRLASCSPTTIDKINIYQAARVAMKRAVKRLVNSKFKYRNLKQYQMTKIRNSKPFRKFGDSDFEFVSDFGFRASNFKTIILIDGKNKIEGLNLPQMAIVKGDRKIFAIACASIIAKVTRDRIMTHLAKKYSQYGLEKHKGYPTKLHKAMLAQHGICEIHRKSFAPVAKLL